MSRKTPNIKPAGLTKPPPPPAPPKTAMPDANMMLTMDEKYLVITDAWFYAPNGERYRAVFGTVKGIRSDKESLGIATNRNSTNWYLAIGNMMIAGCQIHYCIKTDNVSSRPPTRDMEHEGKLFSVREAISHIYMADEEYDA